MITSRTFGYIIFLALSLLALVIHSYYVQYYVSAHEYAILSLKPIPAFAEDRKHWIETEKEKVAKKVSESYSYGGYKYSDVRKKVLSETKTEMKQIYSRPMYLAILPSNNVLDKSLPRAKEKAFWLGCITPLLIALLPAFLLLRNFLERSTSKLIHEKDKTMFCRSCGKQISPSDLFCPTCGVHNSSGVANKPESFELTNTTLLGHHSIDPHIITTTKIKMKDLVIARVLFGLGFLAVLSIVVPVFPSASLYLVVGYVLLCEVVIARAIKVRITPPLTSRQRSLALLPWFIPIIGIIFAFALPRV